MDAASQIPLELLEYIVNLIPSNAALQTCSVTCKALVPASQLRLFRTVTLRTEHQIHAFDTALTTNSNLTPYVFNLGLVDLDELVGVIQPTVSILSKVKGQLRTFSLLGDTVWGCTWGRLDDSIKKAIELLTKQPKFEGADCQFLGDSPVALASLSSVHHLELYYSIRVHYGVAISTPHRLKSLRISYCNVEGDVLAETPETVFSHDKSLLDFSGIERLVVDPTLHRLPGSSSTSSTPSETGPWISFVGKLCASSLVELYWELGSNDLQPPNLLLNDLPCLSSLNIGFSYEKEAPSCEQRCKLLSSWLGTRVPLLPIHSTTFSFPIQDATHEDLGTFLIAIPHASCENITLGFFHHEWERDVIESIEYQQELLMMQAAISKRKLFYGRENNCKIRIINPKVPFSSWIELRHQRPYGHILGPR